LIAAALIPVAPEMKRQSPALVAAAAEERPEEEEGDSNGVGGEVAVFVEKLGGAFATVKKAKEGARAGARAGEDAATNGFKDELPNGLEEKGGKSADNDVGDTKAFELF
jgi:hypothetical protein